MSKKTAPILGPKPSMFQNPFLAIANALKNRSVGVLAPPKPTAPSDAGPTYDDYLRSIGQGINAGRDPFSPPAKINPLSLPDPTSNIPAVRPPLDAAADQANKAAFMASGEYNGPAAPPAAPAAVAATPAAAPNAVADMLQAAIDAIGKPNLADYTTPYDDAIKRANDAYTASTPVINDIYSQLAQKLTAARGTAQSDTASALAAMQAQQAGTQSQLAGLNQQTLADLQRQGGQIQQGAPTAAAQAAAQTQQANLVNQGANQQSFLQNIGAARDASLVDRTSSADAAKAAAMSTAHNTLNSVLDQLGIQKAGAQRQFAADSSAAARQAAQARLSILQGNAAQAKSDHSDFMKAFQDASKQATEPAGDAWLRQNAPTIQAQFPKSYQAFTNIIANTKGTGNQGLAQATDLLHKGLADPAGFSKDFGFVPDQGTYQVISDWLRNYYDSTPTVNEDRFAQALSMLGVDPSQAG